MTVNIILNQILTDAERRELIYSGDIFLISALKSTSKMSDYAFQVLCDKFQTNEPETAFNHLPVEEFAKTVEKVKNEFTNSLYSKELIREFLMEIDSDPKEYFFDVPRIRIVPNYDYLHTGISYAYAPHRDTWYGGPSYQINHWMPVMSIKSEVAMAVWPNYFSTPVQNSSQEFDITFWDKVQRKKAVENIKVESRPHPLPLEEINTESELRIAGNPGDIMIFSANHLHGTIPNRTNRARFSIDFRTFNKSDIQTANNSVNTDSKATGMDGDYLRQMFDAHTFSSATSSN